MKIRRREFLHLAAGVSTLSALSRTARASIPNPTDPARGSISAGRSL